MGKDMRIRLYDPAVDEPRLLNLWDCTLNCGSDGARWPVTPAWFREVALKPGNGQDHLLAFIEGQLIWFALLLVSLEMPSNGSLLALAVHPHHRRQSVGRTLHHAAMERLKMRGVQRCQLGAGADRYFWPGVPADLLGAWPFFQSMGWVETERSYDLVHPLDDYQTPTWVFDRVKSLNITIDTADKANLESQVVDFVTREQPTWRIFYAQAVAENRSQDILLAYDSPGREILGACLIENPSERWTLRFRPPVGAPGAVLTAEAARERGIGMALVAQATEILQARGCSTSFIGWTWLVDWYGKLGYAVWQEYIMSWKNLLPL